MRQVTSEHITVKWLKTIDKENLLQIDRGEKIILCIVNKDNCDGGLLIRSNVPSECIFSSEAMYHQKPEDSRTVSLRYCKKKNNQPRILHSMIMSFKNKAEDIENGLEDMQRGKGKLGRSERVALTYIQYQM